MHKAAIIISTRNRCDALAETLRALAEVAVPSDVSAELILVDNGSTDNTAEVAKNASLPNMTVRLLFEPRRGKSVALNSALAAAASCELLLFIDDDIIPGKSWLEAMSRPLIDGKADIVAGGVRLCERLLDLVPSDLYASRLAVREISNGAYDPNLVVGANMGFSSRVLKVVPGYDPELGVGAIGSGEEGLFVSQVALAGFRGMFCGEAAVVEHRPSAARISRESMLEDAIVSGRSQAYLAYHWHHQPAGSPRLKLATLRAGIAYLLIREALEGRDRRTVSAAMWHQMFHIGFQRQMLREMRRPRNYAYRGLVKLNGHHS